MKLRIVVALVAAALVAGGVSILPKLFADEPEKKPADFTLKTVDGKTMKLADYRGKVVLVDVWATWCPPCRREIPEIINLQKEVTKDKLDVVILGISVDRDKSALPGFIKANKINYPILLAESKALDALGEVEYIPTKFLIDRKGVVRETMVGGATKEELKKKLQVYLKEKVETKDEKK
ncbi:MAG: Sporulation thiol-disulfide oxidoreductase A precursor [bacterium ADurb.Bin429]|nr:MAG: Sporulation thiol-disulfide oxidoreductase A precursor [bacterium ADurb.Bin429]